jgi:Fe-Mn family superoxide dismutase
LRKNYHLTQKEDILMVSDNKETIGNYETSQSGKSVVTRRDVLLMGAVAAAGLSTGKVLAADAAKSGAAAPAKNAAAGELYVARDFSGLIGKKLDGLSQSQIEQHLKLYKGYVGKSNEILAKLKEVDLASANATYSPLRELLMEQSFAVNGVIYHELYFGNLGGSGGEPTGDLKAALDERFGSTGKFMDFLKASGKSMRGWVIVGFNLRGGYLDTFGLDTHNMWSPAGFVPILALDVYEHAYMIDYGVDRAKYLDAFARNVDWAVVAKRLASVSKYPLGLDLTV